MSESDTDERERIRQQKADELRRRLEGEDGADGDVGGDDGGEGTPDEPVHVTGPDHLDRLVADGGVVLVDFYADWCGPCKMLEPIVEEIAAESDAAVLKVDIDELQDLARDAGVRSVPTLQFYANGEEAKRLIGVQDKDDLLDVIADLS
jgi:thioredoxin 1